MRKHSAHHRRPRGAAIVMALIITGFATVGFAAWVGLISQRARSSESTEHIVQRRLSVWNAKASAREYALQRVIASAGDSDGIGFDPLSGWGAVTAPAWSGYPMQESLRIAGLNAFSPSWDHPYSKNLVVTVGTKSLDYARNQTTGELEAGNPAVSTYYQTFIRSRSPVLGGDLLVIHRPGGVAVTDPAITGNLFVDGRVLHFLPESAAGFTARARRFAAPPVTSSVNITPLDYNGAELPVSNIGWTPMTSGLAGGVPDYHGQLNVVDDISNGGNSLKERLLDVRYSTLQINGAIANTGSPGVDNPGTGTITLKPMQGDSQATVLDMPSVIITDEVNELIIEGQEGVAFTTYAPARSSVGVIYTQSAASVRKLATIRLRKQNSRRMLLAIKQDPGVTPTPVNIIVEDVNPTCDWHVVIIAENTPVTFLPNAGVTLLRLIGGIQTNANLVGPAGTGQSMELKLEDDTRGLIRMCPRVAWVETIMPESIRLGPANTITPDL